MDIIFALGRFIFGGYFLIKGITQITDNKKLSAHAERKNIPQAQSIIYLAGALNAMGGLTFIFWYFQTLGAFALLSILLPSTLIMHDYWNEKDDAIRTNEKHHFFKNLALIGAILMLL